LPDLQLVSETAHRTTIESSTEDIAAYLQEVLGQKLTAYVAGVSDPKAVARWAAGERKPRSDSEERLRAAFHVFQLLNTEESAYTARAWFGGLNPQLDDISPAAALREGRLRDVLVAAKAYLAGG
jgi:hypothetical protein